MLINLFLLDGEPYIPVGLGRIKLSSARLKIPIEEEFVCFSSHLLSLFIIILCPSSSYNGVPSNSYWLWLHILIMVVYPEMLSFLTISDCSCSSSFGVLAHLTLVFFLIQIGSYFLSYHLLWLLWFGILPYPYFTLLLSILLTFLIRILCLYWSSSLLVSFKILT